MPELVIDGVADAAYLYVESRSDSRTVVRTVACDPAEIEGMINLDFAEDGTLIGIELIPASLYLPVP
jgi:uncharacterized protein YuzE